MGKKSSKKKKPRSDITPPGCVKSLVGVLNGFGQTTTKLKTVNSSSATPSLNKRRLNTVLTMGVIPAPPDGRSRPKEYTRTRTVTYVPACEGIYQDRVSKLSHGCFQGYQQNSLGKHRQLLRLMPYLCSQGLYG